MSPALPQLHGSELPSPPDSACPLLIQPWLRGARQCGYSRVSRFGMKYSGFLHVDPCLLFSYT
ncbi:hypothetical protein PVAP13_2NG193200 [Panicum virgatum]|uniref:Uncharacterized protein n=1 Tax=Panicum virgatum TaxID=38727 RepID=A0A8T0VM52_PANVG|nr:hypothetical protein PVAP13_2NG193200 [Panicum virgatum]